MLIVLATNRSDTLLTYPLMVAIQEISGRIGRITGHGIAGNVCRNFGTPFIWTLGNGFGNRPRVSSSTVLSPVSGSAGLRSSVFLSCCAKALPKEAASTISANTHARTVKLLPTSARGACFSSDAKRKQQRSVLGINIR
jgi:hypothetical protein